MSAAELRETVAGVGGTLYLRDGHLRLRLPRESRLPSGFRDALRAHRGEIIEALSGPTEQPKPYAVLVDTPYLDTPLWIASDERALRAPDVDSSPYPAVLAVEVLRLGHPADILELLEAKKVFGQGVQAVTRSQ